ncbi:MAG: hypothetical protein ABJN62_04765 [Halioglobus sp.]
MSFLKTAVIFYTGNVCSTPLTQAFKKISGFEVPIHEHLDKYWIQARLEQADISHTFNQALRDIVDHQESALLEKLRIQLPEAQSEYLAFKWRPFSGAESVVSERQKLFEEINAVPFLMLRGSIVNQAVKIALSEKLNGTRHMQFSAAKMSEYEYQERLEDSKKARTALSAREDIEPIVRNFFARSKETLNLAQKYFPTTPINIVKSEDLFTPLLEESVFLKYFSNKLGLNISSFVSSSEEIIARKLGYSKENCINYEEIFRDPMLMKLEERYVSLFIEGRNGR